MQGLRGPASWAEGSCLLASTGLLSLPAHETLPGVLAPPLARRLDTPTCQACLLSCAVTGQSQEVGCVVCAVTPSTTFSDAAN